MVNCFYDFLLTTQETFAETDTTWDVDEEEPLDKKDQSKSSHAARRAARAHHRRMKREFLFYGLLFDAMRGIWS